MPTYSQANRPMAVSILLGLDVLLLQQFSGSESLSRLFPQVAPRGTSQLLGSFSISGRLRLR